MSELWCFVTSRAYDNQIEERGHTTHLQHLGLADRAFYLGGPHIRHLHRLLEDLRPQVLQDPGAAATRGVCGDVVHELIRLTYTTKILQIN